VTLYWLILCFLFLPANSNLNLDAAKYISDSGGYRSLAPNNSLFENISEDRSDPSHSSILEVNTEVEFNEWQSLGGAVRSDSELSVIRNSDGRLGLFVVGTGNDLWHRWQTSPGSSGTWSAFVSLGGTIKGDTNPVVISNSDGRLEVFVVGINNQLYHKWQTAPGSSTWSAFVSLGGTVKDNSNPAVVRNSDGRLEVFVVGINNQLYHKWQTAPGSSTWSGFTNLGGTIGPDTSPTVARNSDGRLEVFVVGTNNGLWHRWQTAPGSSSWSAFVSLGGTINANTDAEAISNSDGRLEVFVIGTNNQLYHKWQTSAGGTTWSAFVSLGEAVKDNSNPAVVRDSDGRLEVFVAGINNQLYHKWQTAPGSSTWSAFVSLGGTIRDDSNPSVAANNDGRLEVFVSGTNNAVWHKWQTVSTGILPTLKDPNLTVEHFSDGMLTPTSMTFVDSNNILVLEKNGNVRLVSNGQLQTEPILQIPVNTQSERGLLGIAGMGNNVFLYYTEAAGTDLRNRVYKYTWNGQDLVNPILLLDLPGTPGPNHDGGKLMIGPDSFLYAVIGDLNRNGKLQNFATGPDPDDTSVILRVSPNDGSPAPGNPLSSDPNNPLSKYYAYGIRNSFGIAFDPLTGRVWDTENGPNVFDEINVVEPGFNSGWEKVMGPIALSGMTVADLVNYPGSHYSDPSLNWRQPIGITDLEFLSSQKLGPSYRNNLFVGDINNGNLYFLTLNAARTGFVLNHPGLSDLIIDDSEERASIILGSGFSGITDILTGPDGLLYVLSYGGGMIYRITQSP